MVAIFNIGILLYFIIFYWLNPQKNYWLTMIYWLVNHLNQSKIYGQTGVVKCPILAILDITL